MKTNLENLPAEPEDFNQQEQVNIPGLSEANASSLAKGAEDESMKVLKGLDLVKPFGVELATEIPPLQNNHTPGKTAYYSDKVDSQNRPIWEHAFGR